MPRETTTGEVAQRLVEMPQDDYHDPFVVSQCRAEFALLSPAPRMHHLRMSEGRHEIDLVVEVCARRLVAIEIKATATHRPRRRAPPSLVSP